MAIREIDGEGDFFLGFCDLNETLIFMFKFCMEACQPISYE